MWGSQRRSSFPPVSMLSAMVPALFYCLGKTYELNGSGTLTISPPAWEHRERAFDRCRTSVRPRKREAMTEQTSPRILLSTSSGDITLELDAVKAPTTAENFLGYVSAGFFDGTMFHRVIPGFMIQGGGFTADMKEKAAKRPITNEADNGLKNDRGTIAMARTSDPHSASSQFFINLQNNDFLNHKAKTGAGWGYAVFGKVVEGMEVVDAIAGVATGTHGPHSDVPREPVTMERVTVLE
jgi:peptidyl-prolyl cis-trans isomerase B (cyclophilin B)